MCYNFIVQTKSISSRFENITVQRPEHFPETNKANHSKHNLKKYIYANLPVILTTISSVCFAGGCTLNA